MAYSTNENAKPIRTAVSAEDGMDLGNIQLLLFAFRRECICLN